MSHATATAGGATSGIVAGVAMLHLGPDPPPSYRRRGHGHRQLGLTYAIWNTADTSPTLSKVTAAAFGGGGTTSASSTSSAPRSR